MLISSKPWSDLLPTVPEALITHLIKRKEGKIQINQIEVLLQGDQLLYFCTLGGLRMNWKRHCCVV